MDLSRISNEEQDNLGAAVAKMKADLHDAEQKLTQRNPADVNWNEIVEDLDSLSAKIEGLSGKSEASHPVKKDQDERDEEESDTSPTTQAQKGQQSAPQRQPTPPAHPQQHPSQHTQPRQPGTGGKK